MDRNGRKVLAVGILWSCLAGLAAGQDGRTIVVAAYGVANRERADVTPRVQSMVRNGTLSFVVSNDALGGDPERGAVKDLSIVVREATGRISEFHFREGQSVNLQVGDGGYSQSRLPEDVQYRFDSFYGRWLEYQQQRDRDEAEQMERRMRRIMRDYNIPPDTPFDSVAWGGTGPARPNRNDLRIERATYGAGNSTVDVTNRLQAMVRGNTLQVRVTNDDLGGDPAPEHHKALFVSYFYQGQSGQTFVNEGDYLKIP